jgi:hypothetical protein
LGKPDGALDPRIFRLSAAAPVGDGDAAATV